MGGAALSLDDVGRSSSIDTATPVSVLASIASFFTNSALNCSVTTAFKILPRLTHRLNVLAFGVLHLSYAG